MTENEPLTREFCGIGGGLAGATITSFHATNHALEVDLRFPNHMVGQIAFQQVLAVRSVGGIRAVLKGGRVFDQPASSNGPERGDSEESARPSRHFEFVAENELPVLAIVAEAFKLIALHEGKAWDRIFGYWERNWNRSGAVNWTKALESFSPGYRGCVSIHWVDTEQGQMGFSSILGNPTGRVFEHAIACYERLGQDRMANILRSALVVAGRESPDDWQTPPSREDFGGLEPLADDLDDLDSLYGDERALLPVAGGVQDEPGLIGTIEYYWRNFPEDFEPAPD